MSGDALHHVASGESIRQRFTARTHNAFVDAARKTREANPAAPLPPEPKSENVAFVKNSSGGDLSRFAILGIDDVLYSPTTNLDEFKNNFAFDGNTPSSSHGDKFVILLAPLADGEIGEVGLAAGIVPCQIDVTDTDHAYAELTDGDATQLTSSTSGAATILWKESGTGTKWAIVRVGRATSPSDIASDVADAKIAMSTFHLDIERRLNPTAGASVGDTADCSLTPPRYVSLDFTAQYYETGAGPGTGEIIMECSGPKTYMSVTYANRYADSFAAQQGPGTLVAAEFDAFPDTGESYPFTSGTVELKVRTSTEADASNNGKLDSASSATSTGITLTTSDYSASAHGLGIDVANLGAVMPTMTMTALVTNIKYCYFRARLWIRLPDMPGIPIAETSTVTGIAAHMGNQFSASSSVRFEPVFRLAGSVCPGTTDYPCRWEVTGGGSISGYTVNGNYDRTATNHNSKPTWHYANPIPGHPVTGFYIWYSDEDELILSEVVGE